MFLARFAARRPWLVIGLFALSSAVAGLGLARLTQTDDLLDFIPPGDADVRAFREVSKTFGALQVAVVGVEARAGDDIFAPEVLAKFAAATEAVKNVHGVDRVVSISNLPDFTPSEAMVQLTPLIDLAGGPPGTPEARKALRDRVMSKEHVVGSFIAPDGRAAIMLVYLASGSSQRAIAHAVRDACGKAFVGLKVVYGGAPFAAAAIFEETESDIRLLTPIAALLILGVILVSFRDPVGVVLAVLTVAWASAVVLGAMGFLGEPYTVVSGTLPVILFASGSSYAVHLLGRYYTDGGGKAFANAAVRAAMIVGPPVAIAGGTTSAGFLSFLVMDIRPMRAFGLESAAGVLLCYLAAMTLVPAVITLWPRPARHHIDTGRIGELLLRVSAWAVRRRWLVLGGAALLAFATVGPMLRVQVKMEPEAFFSEGSDPWLAQHFLDERFGGAQFIQIDLAGDLADPATLMETQRLTQFAHTLPGVTQVLSIVEPLELVNDAMGGGKRLPETREQVTNLLLFIEGEPSLRMVLAPGRTEALVHVRVRGDAAPALAALERWLAGSFHRTPGGPTRAGVTERLGWIAQAGGSSLPPGAAEAAVAQVQPIPEGDPRWNPLARAAALEVLSGVGDLMQPVKNVELRERIAHLVATGDPRARVEFAAAAPSPEEGDLAWRALGDRIHDRIRQSVVDQAMEKIAPALPRPALAHAAATLSQLLPALPIPTAKTPIVPRVAGEPVLDRGFARSVGLNQERSLFVSLIAVYLLMLILFRSGYLAAVSILPSALWMAAVFGAMGLLKVPIDISTSLVASIATGAGSDFAMHYLWYFLRRSPTEAVKVVGPVMAVSSLLVSAGFAVLGAGHSQPMKMFGGLAAIAMAGAFGLTYVLVPALLRPSDHATAQALDRALGRGGAQGER